MQTYTDFLKTKEVRVKSVGVYSNLTHTPLFHFQRDIVERALKKGKYCIFAQTGLGKCLMALTWADELVEQLDIKVLFLAPLGVAKQTISEGEKFGINCKYAADNSQVIDGITVTNYERLDKFDCSQFDAVVLDESSCIKAYSSKTTNQIIETFKQTPYKLSCSATPSPNDFEELGNQCEFWFTFAFRYPRSKV